MAKPIQDSPGTLQYCSLALLASIEVAVLMRLKCGAKADALAHGVFDNDLYKIDPMFQTDIKLVTADCVTLGQVGGALT